MIKTRAPTLTLEQIRCIRVLPGEMLHCAVDVGYLLPARVKEFLDHIRAYLLSVLPAGTNLLVTSDKVSFTVIQP